MLTSDSRKAGPISESTRVSSRAAWLALILILIVGAILRAWNIDYGLPHMIHPDEQWIVEPALRMANPETFDLDPNFYNYPAFPIYTLAAVYFVQGVWSPRGTLSRPNLPGGFGAVTTARWVTSVFGLATVAAVFALGVAFRSRMLGLLAALFLAVAPFHLLDSHYANVDIPMTFWAVLAATFALRHLDRGRRVDLCIAAVCVGLAGASKYTGLLMAPALPVAAWFGLRASTVRFTWRRFAAAATLAAVLTLSAFVAAAPYTIARSDDVAKALRYESEHMREGHFGWDLNVRGTQYRRIVYPLLVGFPFVLGVPLYLATLGGLASVRRRDKSRFLVLAAAFGLIAVAVFTARVVFPRYLIPLIPLAVLCAAIAVERMILSRRLPLRWTGIAAAATIFIYSTAFAGSMVSGLEPQTATRASEWVESNIPTGSQVAVGVVVWTFSLPQGRYRLERFDLPSAVEGAPPPQWLVINSWYSRPWERGSLRDSLEHGYLSALGKPDSRFELVAAFTSTYFHEDFYGRLDPMLRNQFESPDVLVYRRRTPAKSSN